METIAKQPEMQRFQDSTPISADSSENGTEIAAEVGLTSNQQAKEHRSLNISNVQEHFVPKNADSPNNDTNIATGVGLPSPGQAQEPRGTSEWINRNEDGQVDIRRRRRLKPVANSDSENDGSDNGQEAEHSANDEREVEDANPDIQEAVESNRKTSDVESDGESLDLNGVGSREDSDDGDRERTSSPKKLRVEDFDDEEEFLLAGGEIEEAKKRKEWGLHQSDDEDKDPTTITEEGTKLQDTNLSKENLRKLQRESERLLRERRCMIPPAPVQRRSFCDLVKKISNRSQTIDKSKPKYPDITDVDTKAGETLSSVPTELQRPDAQSSPPDLPCDDQDQYNSKPTGVNEEEDDDELIIIAPRSPNRNKSIEAPVSHDKPQPVQPANIPQAKSLMFSPPSNNAKRSRIELKKSWMETAQLRSEHVMKAKIALSIQTKESFLAPKDSPAFIAAPVFDGSRPGYVFKLGNDGLGFYKDEKLSCTLSNHPIRAIGGDILPPPMQDLPDDNNSNADRSPQDGLDSEGSQPKLVLEYQDEEANEVSTDLHSDCAVVDSGLAAASDSPAIKPLRTYAKKDRHIVRTEMKCDAGTDESKALVVRMANAEEPVASDGEDHDSSDDDDSDSQDGDDEDNGEGDDGEDLSEEEDDDEEDDEDDEEQAPALPQKKTLADITSIKRQTTLRLGTMEAGYLRTEQEALGIHEDIGVAEEDLGEGIDLENTDGEDASEEDENSEEERKVAEGFLEDAKYAGEVNPEMLREAHMDMMEKDEQRMTDKILDVIRGDVRRRKAAQENDDWIPNRNARLRLQTNGENDGGEVDPNGTEQDFDALEAQEEEAARVAAALAKDRLERMKFAQQKRELDAIEHSSGDEDQSAVSTNKTVPLVRKTSCAVPSLAEFGRSFCNGGLVRSISGSKESTGSSLLKRGSSLLGLSRQQSGEGQGQQGAQLPSSKVFFFDTKQRSDSANDSFNASESVPAVLPPQASLVRKRSGTSWNMIGQKAAKTGSDMKRSASVLRQNLDIL